MRSAIVVSAFAALALAAPRPQEIEFDLVDAAPDVTVVTAPVVGTSETVAIQPAAEAVALGSSAVTDTTTTKKRDTFNKRDGDCSVQPAGTGPAVSSPDDTPGSFLNYAPFHTTAQKYAQTANVPQGYTLAFSDLQASSQTVSWLGYKTLSSYDPIACQQFCDALDKCVAFNIYYERDPSVDPNTQNCANPPSITNIKCSRWGVQIQPETATNDGQTRAGFQVVISGSNGYNKIAGPPSKTGFTGPTPLGGAINAPNDPTTNTNTYMGYKFFSLSSVQSYNDGVAACLAAATEQGAYNSRHPPKTGSPSISNQVVVYVLSMNNIPQGVYCSMYTEAWAPQYATNLGQYRGTDVYTVSQAYSYTNATYAAQYGPICNVGGCSPYYKGGNCGGWGVGTC